MTARLEKALKQLPPDAVEQVADYAEFLAQKKLPRKTDNPSPPRKIGLSWAGALSDLKDKYKSGVELQHAVNDMRVEMASRQHSPSPRKDQ